MGMEGKEWLQKLIRHIKRPQGWGLIALCLLFVSVLTVTVYLIVHPPEGAEPVAYVFYGLSAVLLGYLIYIFIRNLREMYAAVAEKNLFVGRLKNDYEYRTLIFSLIACVVSAGITVYYFTLFGLSMSVWYGTLAFYYGALVLTRGGTLLSRRIGRWRHESPAQIKKRDAEAFLGSGAMLTVMAFTFSASLALMVAQDRHVEYAGLTIYVAAFYAFWKAVSAVVNLFKARKREDLTVRALRNVNIADALISVIALQAAMLQQFLGAAEALNPHIFNAVTGGIVIVLIVVIGSNMIVRGYRRLCELRTGSPDETAPEDIGPQEEE